MKQEDKELLLQDLCARLPYEVKCNISRKIDTCAKSRTIDSTLDCHWLSECKADFYEIKPYLFPLSSMTEEQYKSLEESGILSNCSHSYEYVNPYIHGVSFIFKQFKTYSLELIEWLNKNHFDYRDLIPMGLAIDCTNLNIY